MRLVLILLVVAGFTYISSAERPSVEEQLAANRQQIDAIDRQIVQLINQRAAVVAKIGQIKSASGLAIAAPHREEQVLNHIAQIGRSGPFPIARLQRIYSTLLAQMRDWEQEQHDTK